MRGGARRRGPVLARSAAPSPGASATRRRRTARSRLHALAGAAVGLAALLGGCESSGITSRFELTGRVTVFNEGSPGAGSPIAGATVTFESDTRLVAETTTNGSGRYRLDVDSDDDFGEVRAEAEGFRPATATVFFDRPSRRVDLALPRARDE
ncbi:MAG: carboxypeptidase-like regulatory domain-containing protein [Sandaracinaceae bacterium]